MSRRKNYIIKEQIVFDNELLPATSPYDVVWPISVLDAIIDQIDPEQITLREILARMKRLLDDGPDDLSITFPVTSVRGWAEKDLPITAKHLGDVIISKHDIGLGNVDNTSDADKPISNQQLSWITNYVTNSINNIPPVDLSILDDHITNYNNPHRVTLDQLNVSDGPGSDGVITDLIKKLIIKHDQDGNSHDDIRILIENVKQWVIDNSPTMDNFLNILNNIKIGNNQMADMPTAHFKGRVAPGTGPVQDVPISDLIQAIIDSIINNPSSKNLNTLYGGVYYQAAAPNGPQNPRSLWIPSTGVFINVPHYWSGTAWTPIKAVWGA